MKTFVLRFSSIAIVFLLLFTAISTTSCKKDKTCYGKVMVVDTAGIPVAVATVKLAAPSVNGQVEYVGTTDGSGVVSFEVKLPAIFDVFATQAANYPGMTGVGVLRLDEPGKKTETTVTIK
ncbi:MAG: hypothetical protein A3F72_09680 [Bacteroidetes bacterium RIFCSPLOWO2_12_FULL_35_15]|nr:MAG: hypothetical protein A3F72_09680 [Bacteroidetes bacterium RIFCSPLOWO2_12_FULL_35_15]